MSVRTFHECDYYDDVEALRCDLDEQAAKARAYAEPEDFAAALERRLEQRHAPHTEAIDTGGAAAHDPPPDGESDISSQSGDNDDESPPEDKPGVVPAQRENNEGESASDESKDDTLSSDEIDGIRLSIDDIRNESETIERLLARKSSLSVEDLDAIIRREKALLSQVRAMRKQLNV